LVWPVEVWTTALHLGLVLFMHITGEILVLATSLCTANGKSWLIHTDLASSIMPTPQCLMSCSSCSTLKEKIPLLSVWLTCSFKTRQN